MLPDIAFCSNKECKKSETCRRYASHYEWDGEVATFCDFKDLPDKPCEDYWPWNFVNTKPIEVDTGVKFYREDADYDDWGDVEESTDEITIDDLIRCQKSYIGYGSVNICPTCRFYGKNNGICESRLMHEKTIEILEKYKEMIKGEY